MSFRRLERDERKARCATRGIGLPGHGTGRAGTQDVNRVHGLVVNIRHRPPAHFPARSRFATPYRALVRVRRTRGYTRDDTPDVVQLQKREMRNLYSARSHQHLHRRFDGNGKRSMRQRASPRPNSRVPPCVQTAPGKRPALYPSHPTLGCSCSDTLGFALPISSQQLQDFLG
jgi:hypothetical protein